MHRATSCCVCYISVIISNIHNVIGAATESWLQSCSQNPVSPKSGGALIVISHQHLWQANYGECHGPHSNLSGLFSAGLFRLIEGLLALTGAWRFSARVLNPIGSAPDQHTIEHGICSARLHSLMRNHKRLILPALRSVSKSWRSDIGRQFNCT